MKSGRALPHEFPCSPGATCAHETLSTTVLQWEILGTTCEGGECLARHGNQWSPDTDFGAITGALASPTWSCKLSWSSCLSCTLVHHSHMGQV